MGIAPSLSRDAVTVLVVDDDEDMRVLVRGVFAGSELLCHVEEAATGLAGLDAFERLAAAGARCILVVDLQMPDIDGLELGQRVLRRAPHQPMILFTGYCTSVVREHARRMGFDQTVSKTDVRELPAVVEDLLRLPTHEATIS